VTLVKTGPTPAGSAPGAKEKKAPRTSSSQRLGRARSNSRPSAFHETVSGIPLSVT
jgi:hypothetical protein